MGRRYLQIILVSTALVFGTRVAMGSGFALKEQSATAQGNAFAGATAAAEDISFMFFNPAGLTRQSGTQAMGVLSGILPQAEPSNANGRDLAGNTLLGTGGPDDLAIDALVPSFYVHTQLNEDLHFGMGINAPFGLKTSYDADWIGRYHALTSDLQTLDINPAVAYKVTNWLSIGVGLQAQYADARLTNAIDTGSLASIPDGGSTALDSFGEVEGDDWGFGYTLGLLVEPADGTRVGFGYRSRVHHKLEGNASFILSAAGQGILAGTGAFADTGASAKLTTPASASFGVYHEITDKFAVMGDVSWTDWSEFKELRIQFDNPAQADSVTVENWDDTIFAAIGATYRLDDQWTLRSGLAYDESPIPDSTRTPRIPGADRYWVSVGAGYSPTSWLDLNVGYTHIFLDDSTVRLPGTGTDALRGSLNVDYESSIDIIVLSGRIRF